MYDILMLLNLILKKDETFQTWELQTKATVPSYIVKAPNLNNFMYSQSMSFFQDVLTD